MGKSQINVCFLQSIPKWLNLHNKLKSKQNKCIIFQLLDDTHDKKASIVYRKLIQVTCCDCRNFHLRAGLNVAAWRKIIKLAEFFFFLNTNQGFLIELSLLSKERKIHQIHILGGTDNMKHDTAPNKTCRWL